MINRDIYELGAPSNDDGTIDYVKYSKWLRGMIIKGEYTNVDYEAHKKAMAEKGKLASIAGRDIGKIPGISNIQLRNDCEFNFQLYCESYFPESFPIAWSDDHLKAIAKIEDAVLRGALFALAMPRGSGKTTLVEIACIWAHVYGHRQFIFLVGADEVAAGDMLTSIKSEYEHNELLLADFPEVCYPIHKIEGNSQRTHGQLCQGERTEITWKTKEVVLPTIKGSKSSGACIRIAGITGKIRGAKRTLATGEKTRPDLVIIDDPQTDESANSVTQCASRLSVVTGAILGLAGPKKKIAGFMPCTVIVEGDMADTVLNADLYPDWQGMRTKMLVTEPTNIILWEQYEKIRSESLKSFGNIENATVFYVNNRDAMDAGAYASWSQRFNEDEVSAIQNSMNLKFRDEYAFYAEYQNEPKSKIKSDSDMMSAIEISQKISGQPMYSIPYGCIALTAGIDVQKGLLFYTIIAWDEDGNGHVIDYGAWPKQNRRYFTKNDHKKSFMDDKQVVGGMTAKLAKALKELTASIMDKYYLCDNGVEMAIDLCLIDANWSESKKTVYEFCRRSGYRNRIRPSHGRYYGATVTPMSERAAKEGERKGHNWVVTYPKKNTETIRYVFFDTNYWKSWLHERLSVDIGGFGCLTLWGDDPERHRMFGDHLTAEHVILVEAKNRKVNEWKENVGRPDNDLLDTSVLACVAASMSGITVKGMTTRALRRRGLKRKCPK